jgi:transcriptional regulator with XRE-family HTH domain
MINGKEIQYRKVIGLQLKEQLNQFRISQAEAAKKANITEAQASNIFNGNSSYTIDTLTKFIMANDFTLKFDFKIFKNYKEKYWLT